MSATQENLRLYTCICLQRLSRGGFRLFSDPLEPECASAARLQVLLNLLANVHSFNIRAIVLNVILQAVRVPSQAEQDAARAQGGAGAGPGSSSSSAASPSIPDLVLPPEALDALRDFRASCGSIGSSASSRRTSPAFGALVAARANAPPSLGGAMHSAAAAASAAPSASAARSWRANSSAASSAPPATATAASATPATAAAVSYSAAASTPPAAAAAAAAAAAPALVEDTFEGADDDEVSELSRDPEAGLDKTAHLQQLVDAILQAHAAEAAK